MKKIISFLLLLLSLNVQAQLFGCNPKNINWQGKTAIFFGNSITYGVAASDNAHRWTSLFCAAKGCTESNRGVSGTVLQDTTIAGCASHPTFSKTSIPIYDGTQVLFITLGVNDCGLNTAAFTPALYKAKYLEIIQYAITVKGFPPCRIIIQNLYNVLSYIVFVSSCGVSAVPTQGRIDAYNQAVADVAAATGVVMIDIYAGMAGLNSSYFNADLIHPNDAGHAVIANYLISVL